MAPKIFITGATGYIGGDALFALYKAHPEYEYTALVRNSDRGAEVAAQYPIIRMVYGTLDDSSVLEEEAAKADIVIHTADSSDHLSSSQALTRGLARSHSSNEPGYYIHVSGTGILCWKDTALKLSGEPPHQAAYDDLEDVTALTSLPDEAWHRNVDKAVLAASSASVKTAIVCPPTIYGPGRGPKNQRSKQVYELTRVTLERKKAPVLGTGLTEWDNVHVHDLSDLFVLQVEAAVAKDPKNDAELWGENGYFLAENGHHVWGEVAKWVAEAAFKQGYIPAAEVETVGTEEAKELAGLGALTWGLNSKGLAKRAKKYLGWSPKGASLKDEIADIVDGEAVTLGLKKSHREKVSGSA